MNPDAKRIAAIEVDQEGLTAAVWLGYDKISDVVTLYDCCKFNAEVLAVISEGLNARGRWIPIVWNVTSQDFRDKIAERGCNTLYDGYKESPQLAEMASRDIEERMRTGRFKVDRRLAEWLQEFQLFSKEGGKIPKAGYPLMAATRYAMANLKRAKRLQTARASQTTHRRIAMI